MLHPGLLMLLLSLFLCCLQFSELTRSLSFVSSLTYTEVVSVVFVCTGLDFPNTSITRNVSHDIRGKVTDYLQIRRAKNKGKNGLFKELSICGGFRLQIVCCERP